MEKANAIPNKNMTVIYQNLAPNLELKLFVSGQLTFLLEKCPNNSSLTAKIVDLDDRYLVQLNLASERDLLFSTGEDEIVAVALDTAITDLADQMRFWNKERRYEASLDFEAF